MKLYFSLMLLVLSFSFVIAQEKSDRQFRDDIQKKNAMIKKEWEKFAAPDENHQSLDFMAGSWKAALNVYDSKGNIVLEGMGTCETRWILEKRFLLNEHSFSSYKAASLLGYDKYSKKFVSAYADNQGTGLYKSEGNREDDGRLVLEGRSVDYSTSESIQTRYVYSEMSDSGYKFTIYNISSEKPLKTFEITYTKSTEVENKTFWLEKKDIVANQEDVSEYAKVGQKHKNLSPLLGQWKVSYLIYDDAGNVVMAPEGVTLNRTVLGGRFVILHYRLLEYRALAVIGYDNLKKKYTSLYVDTSGTAINTREGEFKDGKQLILQGKSIDYATGKQMELTSQTTIETPQNYTFQLYDQRDKEQLQIIKVHMRCNRLPKKESAE